MATTTYRGYELQVTGTNSGTWGSTLNTDVFTKIDKNLGGITSKSLSSSNISLSASESEAPALRLTGTLSANVQVTTSAQGFIYVENLTTGSYTVTVTNGVSGEVVPQGIGVTMFADATNGARIVSNEGLIGSNNLSDVASAATAFSNIKQAATETATGVVELATLVEAAAGTDTERAVTAAGLEAHHDGKAATQVEQEAASAVDVYVSPGRQKFHPLSPKAWGLVTVSGSTATLTANSGVASVSRTAAGQYTVTLTTAMSSADYAVLLTSLSATAAGAYPISCLSRTTTQVSVVIKNTAGDATDGGGGFCIMVMGDH